MNTSEVYTFDMRFRFRSKKCMVSCVSLCITLFYIRNLSTHMTLKVSYFWYKREILG